MFGISSLNQDERARRLQELIDQKRADLAGRRQAARPANPAQAKQTAGVGLALAVAAWLTGLSSETLQGLGLLGQLLAELRDLSPLFYGLAIGLAAAALVQRRRPQTGLPRGAAVLVCLTLLVLIAGLISDFG